MVEYNSKFSTCYLCKEQLKVVADEAEETWYFVNAKVLKNVTPTKEEACVHTKCLKDIQKNVKNIPVLGKRSATEAFGKEEKKNDVNYSQ
mmetsp:Transcript_99392/g.136635  ORF Transcript_99392/g.136635 Transcript_99392/m.136635 type:complete len:90 (+) Transcript_99392:1871-2140(+)|eukprot:CAMPEP_0176401730 /NCGR_PEP_ID=MMETSP0126-20121128/48673_1 /TAXON_ID=141414 ORGANISM="Strombidinopsis acuminatum, Strain SPMC142" /NCGR_SAMPLE_ID=MMETSP0126 /ASSEMBLY_ACC=CAM_ASM_000229 /LENGTH=89 /DNA_ID=CAMNT_0017778845 /DNA_START=1904 /DNA_END=2173 /DNA_ORIENTATION=-